MAGSGKKIKKHVFKFIEMIKIIDYGQGNLASIKNMITYLGYSASISSNIDEIKKASKLILPGVGSFDTGINNLRKLDLFSLIKEKVMIDKCPILGICLGAQLMLEKSAEGNERGLSVVKGEVVSFSNLFVKKNIRLPIPNMGWRDVEFDESFGIKFKNKPPKFYFVHSFFIDLKEKGSQLIKTKYGIEFCAGFKYEHIMAVQFHPEKSHNYGKEVLKYFINNV